MVSLKYVVLVIILSRCTSYMQVIKRGTQLVKCLMLAHLNLPFLHADMSTGWSAHSNILDPQQADNQAHLDEGIEAIKAFLLQHGVSVPLKNFTICFLLGQMRALKLKPDWSYHCHCVGQRKSFLNGQCKMYLFFPLSVPQKK